MSAQRVPKPGERWWFAPLLPARAGVIIDDFTADRDVLYHSEATGRQDARTLAEFRRAYVPDDTPREPARLVPPPFVRPPATGAPDNPVELPQAPGRAEPELPLAVPA